MSDLFGPSADVSELNRAKHCCTRVCPRGWEEKALAGRSVRWKNTNENRHFDSCPLTCNSIRHGKQLLERSNRSEGENWVHEVIFESVQCRLSNIPQHQKKSCSRSDDQLDVRRLRQWTGMADHVWASYRLNCFPCAKRCRQKVSLRSWMNWRTSRRRKNGIHYSFCKTKLCNARFLWTSSSSVLRGRKLIQLHCTRLGLAFAFRPKCRQSFTIFTFPFPFLPFVWGWLGIAWTCTCSRFATMRMLQLNGKRRGAKAWGWEVLPARRNWKLHHGTNLTEIKYTHSASDSFLWETTKRWIIVINRRQMIFLTSHSCAQLHADQHSAHRFHIN